MNVFELAYQALISTEIDAVYRFKDIPDKFYQDWIQVAFEESQHFSLINHY